MADVYKRHARDYGLRMEVGDGWQLALIRYNRCTVTVGQGVPHKLIRFARREIMD